MSSHSMLFHGHHNIEYRVIFVTLYPVLAIRTGTVELIL